jgi:hypothetical protein
MTFLVKTKIDVTDFMSTGALYEVTREFRLRKAKKF